MPHKDKHLSSSSRCCRSQMATLGNSVPLNRPCFCCSQTFALCRVIEGNNKCLEYIWSARPCDLAPIDIARWRRHEEQRRQLKKKLEQSIAKQSRLLNQINQIESTQQNMVETEFRNIEALKKTEEQTGKIGDKFTVDDIAITALVFSDPWESWPSMTLPVSETSQAAPGSSQGF